MKHSFLNDYSEGAHPRVLELLVSSNLRQESGYGEDALSLQAASLLREATGNADAAVHLVSGGTQANLIALASMLKPYESVITVETAHILVHETGAIEATGHKIHGLPGHEGKLSPGQVREVVAQHCDEHMVLPRVVYLSQATEVGTLYSKAELTALSATCRELGLYLYLDGARIAPALVSAAADMTLRDVSALVDMLYVGGTKNGALLGEALVINTPALQERFRFHLKQRGALLAKGRLLGAQFVALLEDGLYFELARHANAMAAMLADGLRSTGTRFLSEPVTNQVFPILADTQIAALRSLYGFHVWSRVDPGHSAIRLVTSWATRPEAVQGFLQDFAKVAVGHPVPGSRASPVIGM
ncbi:threonine aldolase family protein [Cognatiluteimonas profundi]|uniref:threonine aldolase family protein n=1 Tax=Cognatiluteimonas profundi TaxID=2594501 RepID=UPI00131CB774|nr:beta-eliminating lyase-related protein [Lysobacter profundi]